MRGNRTPRAGFWFVSLLCCSAALAQDHQLIELPQSSGAVNPLRKATVTRAKSAGRWVEWRAGAKWEGEYTDGKRHGIWEGTVPITDASHFSESDYEGFESPFTIRVTLDRNVPHGEISGVDAQQRPIFTWNFDQGVLEGSAVWWHPSGQMRRQVTYRAGLLDGSLTEWNTDGVVVLQETYQEGRGRRAQIEWHQQGRKRFEGHAQLPGEVARDEFDWINLRWSQTIVHEFSGEERCGRWTAWYSNGQKKLQGSYQDGLAEGRFTWWHSNGQKMAEGNYTAGKRHGPWRHWHANGIKYLNGDYEHGQLAGNWSAWTADGRVSAFDRKQAALTVDWDAPKTDEKATVKTAPVSRPTRVQVVDEPHTGEGSILRTSRQEPVSRASSNAKSKPPHASTSARSSSKNAAPQTLNHGLFPDLLPTASSEPSDAEIVPRKEPQTLLGLLTAKKSQQGNSSASPAPKASRKRSTEAMPAWADAQTSDVSEVPTNENGNGLADLLGLEPAQPRRPPGKPVRR